MSWTLQEFAEFPPSVKYAPADTGLWVTDSAVEHLALTMDAAPLLDEVPLDGVWIGFESPLNALGHTVRALHLQSLEGMAYKASLLIAAKQGIPAHRVPLKPPSRLRHAFLAEGLTYLSAYTTTGPQNVFSTELVCKTWELASVPENTAQTLDMIRIAEAHGGRMSPQPTGDVGILVALVRAAMSAHAFTGTHGVTSELTRVPVANPDADYADITVLRGAL